MITLILFFVHYALLLLLGIFLSFSFAGIRLRLKSNRLRVYLLFLLCAFFQILVFIAWGYDAVWRIYPLISHVPIVLTLKLYYKVPLRTSILALCSAYICCNPANWVAETVQTLTDSAALTDLFQIITLLITGALGLCILSPYLWRLYTQKMRSIWVLGSIPVIYYLYDYATGVYSDLWIHNRIVIEFLPFLLCIFYLLFCVVYYREYEQRMDLKQREQIILTSVQQYTNQLEAIKRSEQELRILRHDMRLFLSSLTVCLTNGEMEKAKEMLASYDTKVQQTKLHRFCNQDIVNYILSDFSARCDAAGVDFHCDVALTQVPLEDTLFISILSNALDNALNAQTKLPISQRKVWLMLKSQNGKLLLSTKNPVSQKPIFVDGIPLSNEEDHGYGTQSIRYTTERLGGKYQFSMQDDLFVLRVILNLPPQS